MKSRAQADMTAAVFALVAVLCWCTVPLFIKYFTAFFDKYTQNALRYSVAAIFWLPALIVLIRAGKVGRSVWIAAIFPAVVNTVAQTTWSWSLYYIDPAIVGFISQLNAIWANVLAMYFFRDERSLLRQPAFWIGTIFSTSGFLMMVAGHPNLWAWDTIIGIAIMTAGSLPWGLYPVSVRLNVSQYPPIAAFAVIALYTALACDLLTFVAYDPLREVMGSPLSQVGAASWQVLGWVVLSAILGIGVAHVLYYSAINRLGVAVTAGILLTTPFATALLAILLRNEHMRPVQWLGGIGLVAGTGLLLYAKQRLTATAARRPRPPVPVEQQDGR